VYANDPAMLESQLKELRELEEETMREMYEEKKGLESQCL